MTLSCTNITRAPHMTLAKLLYPSHLHPHKDTVQNVTHYFRPRVRPPPAVTLT